MSTTDFISNIKLLNRYHRTNYQLWKVEVKDVLVANKVWPYVSGEIKRPLYYGPGNGREAAQEWDSKDALARLIIRRFLHHDLTKRVAVLATSKLAWDFIEDRVTALVTLDTETDDGFKSDSDDSDDSGDDGDKIGLPGCPVAEVEHRYGVAEAVVRGR